jgi:hypothetical protein
MRKEKDEVVRCGYKVGGGAERDQAFEKEYARGGKAAKDCDGGRVKKAFGGPMNGQGNVQNQEGAQQNPNQMRKPQVMPTNLPPVQQNPQAPVMMNYGLKKGGKASAKSAVKEMLKTKEVKPPKMSAALIESISIIPKKSKAHRLSKEEGGQVQEKAIGGAAKIRQGTFGLKGNPPIKR